MQPFEEDVVLSDGTKVHTDPHSVRDFLEIERLRGAVRKLRRLVNDAVAWDAPVGVNPLERDAWMQKAKEALVATAILENHHGR